MRGVLNIDKPEGISSYDAIRRLKRLLDRPHPAIGHAGTLDPAASGVLLVLLGAATKISRLLMNSPKVYVATVEFGVQTDTDDATGHVVARAPAPKLDRGGLAGLLASFAGTTAQLPPTHSAIKQAGVPLYRLARQGKPVRAKPRAVTIHHLDLLDWQPPVARFRAEVSAGTYIRALARDIGLRAGSRATLTGLRRTRSGRFRLEDSTRLDDVTGQTLGTSLTPVAEALADLPRLTVTPAQAEDLRMGRRVGLAQPHLCAEAVALTPDQRFLALVRVDGREARTNRIVYADA